MRQFKDRPEKCCIQTKVYRLYRKMTIYNQRVQGLHVLMQNLAVSASV